MIHLYAAAIDHIEDLEERIKELEALLAEVWAKTESYRARMDYHMMLRGESKKAYEELKERVEKALAEKPFKAGVLPYAPTEERENG